MDRESRRNAGSLEPGESEEVAWRSGSRTADVVAEIWCEVLELSEVADEDNFFDIGGHSILLQLVQDRVQRRTGQSVALIEFFNHPTVRSLARYLDGLEGPAGANGDGPAGDGARAAGGIGRRGAAGRGGGPSRLGSRRAQLGGGRTRGGRAGD